MVNREPIIDGHGFSVQLPAAWEGRIYQRATPTTAFTPKNRAADSTGTNAARAGDGWLGEQTRAVLHLGNFALPGDRGDYGSGAVERMGADNTFVAILEFGQECLGTALYSSVGLPRVSPGPVRSERPATPDLRSIRVPVLFHGAESADVPVRGSRIASECRRAQRAGQSGARPDQGGRRMTMTLTERLVHSIGAKPKQPQSFPARISRRCRIGRSRPCGGSRGATWSVRPTPTTRCAGQRPACADGYSVFCCTINGGSNTCPPNSFIGGWWKADNSSFCGGSARYYIDCNAYRDGAWQCRCAEGTCDQRRVACNQFRYGQCSLDVPASNTGPVVCRMVSCTPPWQQFGGTCTSSSATDNRTATHAAPCLNAHSPMGSVDMVAAEGESIRVLGWAYDPDQPGTEIKVAVYVDGDGISWFDTGKSRGDVNDRIRDQRQSRLRHLDPGVRRNPQGRCVRHQCRGRLPNPLLGGGTVTVGAVPIGCLDSLFGAPDSKIRIRGWAFDPDEPATEIKVAVYRDGTGIWLVPDRPCRGRT